MAYGGYSAYLRLGWTPDPDEYLMAEFGVTPGPGKTLEQAAQAVAAESSIGTWTSLSTMQRRVLERLAARVYRIDGKKRKLWVAYPIGLFEDGNASQILSDIAGNIFGMKEVNALRLEDFRAPEKYLRTFPGPAFGREGVRKMAGTQKSRRPHLGTIVKPKVGLTPKEGARVAYEAWMGGLDFVKDDENLTDHNFSRFEERVVRYLEARDRAEEETGKKKIYAPNITAPAGLMLRRAEWVKAHGGECVMMDVVTAGFSGVQYIRNENLGMVIHAHRAMYAAFSRNPKHGMSMRCLAKLCRMCGTDQLHIGAIVGKMEGSAQDVVRIHNDMNGGMAGYKPVFSVCSGGLSPLQVPGLMKIIGNEIVIQAGGGVHGHPGGTRAGARALAQAAEAALEKIPLERYAKTHPELAQAIGKWGRKT